MHIQMSSSMPFVLYICHQSHCGGEEAVKKSYFVCDETVCSAVSQVVCAVFVCEQ